MCTISQCCLIFAYIQVGRGQGEVGGGGESHHIYKTEQKLVHGKNVAVYSGILGLKDSVHFLPELKDVAFCI